MPAAIPTEVPAGSQTPTLALKFVLSHPMRKQAIKLPIFAVNAESFLRFCGTRPQPHPAQKGRARGLRCRGQQIAFGDKSPRRGQNPPICEDSPPPSARLPWRAQQKPRPQPAESQDGRFGATRGLTYRQILSTAVRFSMRRDAALPAAPSHAESNRCYDILEQFGRRA